MDMNGMEAELLGLLQVEHTDRYPSPAVALNAEMRGICKRRSTRYNWTEGVFVQAATDETVPLPVRWKKTDRLWYLHPQDGSVVEMEQEVDRRRFDGRYPPSTPLGIPRRFVVSGDTIYMRPAPSADLSIVHEYWEILADVSGAGTNPLIQDHWEMIVYAAAAFHGSLWIGEGARMQEFAPIAQRLEADYVAACGAGKADGPRRTFAPGRVRGR